MRNLKNQLVENVDEFVKQHGDLSGFVLLAMGECNDGGDGKCLGMVDGTGAQIHMLLCQLLDNDPTIFTGLMFELLKRKCGDSDMFDQLVDHMPEWDAGEDSTQRLYTLDDIIDTLKNMGDENDG